MSIRSLQRRIAMEKRITAKACRDLLTAGFLLAVDNGDENTSFTEQTADWAKIRSALYETDEARVFVYHRYEDRLADKAMGWVFFVFGNDGYDVMNDYTVNLESYLHGARVLVLAESMCDQVLKSEN